MKKIITIAKNNKPLVLCTFYIIVIVTSFSFGAGLYFSSTFFNFISFATLGLFSPTLAAVVPATAFVYICIFIAKKMKQNLVRLFAIMVIMSSLMFILFITSYPISRPTYLLGFSVLGIVLAYGFSLIILQIKNIQKYIIIFSAILSIPFMICAVYGNFIFCKEIAREHLDEYVKKQVSLEIEKIASYQKYSISSKEMQQYKKQIDTEIEKYIEENPYFEFLKNFTIASTGQRYGNLYVDLKSPANNRWYMYFIFTPQTKELVSSKISFNNSGNLTDLKNNESEYIEATAFLNQKKELILTAKIRIYSKNNKSIHKYTIEGEDVIIRLKNWENLQ